MCPIVLASAVLAANGSLAVLSFLEKPRVALVYISQRKSGVAVGVTLERLEKLSAHGDIRVQKMFGLYLSLNLCIVSNSSPPYEVFMTQALYSVCMLGPLHDLAYVHACLLTLVPTVC